MTHRSARSNASCLLSERQENKSGVAGEAAATCAAVLAREGELAALLWIAERGVLERIAYVLTQAEILGRAKRFQILLGDGVLGQNPQSRRCVHVMKNAQR